MFTRLISLLLIIATLFSGTRIAFYVGYTLNKDYLAKVLCVNKDKPAMNCNGKCYLAKKIKQAEEKEKKQEQQSHEKRFQEALITQRFVLNFPVAFDITTTPFELPFDLPQHSASVFHPPKV